MTFTSLVTCPVALYPATSEAETVHFNHINPETNILVIIAGVALERVAEKASRGRA
jgi:non-homologous end joining protein Ku